MKRFVVLLLVLCGFCTALAEEVPKYEVYTSSTVNLRQFADSDIVIKQIPKHAEVLVIEYGTEWCYVDYYGMRGYVKSPFLYRYRSLDPYQYTAPGQVPCTGYITFNEDAFISGDVFEGVTAQPGQMACISAVTEEGYALPVWRGETLLPAESATYTPFVPWQDAEPGDVIGGFTTYYGEQQGQGLAEGREANIRIGCERINGLVIEPEEIVSFNDVCGPYSSANGYHYAPNVGGTGFGYGGGVCQVTTTLCNAIMTVPVQIVEWNVHQHAGVAYVPQFFDASVGRTTDFRFQNVLPYAITLQAVPQDGVLTVLISRQ